MAQGVVKSYDPNSGSGIVLLDTDKTEVYIQPGSCLLYTSDAADDV